MPRSKELSEQMRAESRAQLLRAARQLFAEQGYFNCTVADIAQAAGMSQGNVYWYFRSKQALLQAVLADGFETLGQLMAETVAEAGTFPEKLEALLTRYIAFGRERGAFTTIFLSLMSHGGLPFLRKLGFDLPIIGQGYHLSVTAILMQGQAEGVVPADLETSLLTMLFFSLFNGLMITYGEEWQAVPEAQIKAAARRLLGVAR